MQNVLAIAVVVVVPFIARAVIVIWPLVSEEAGVADGGGGFREGSLGEYVLGGGGRKEGGMKRWRAWRYYGNRSQGQHEGKIEACAPIPQSSSLYAPVTPHLHDVKNLVPEPHGRPDRPPL